MSNFWYAAFRDKDGRQHRISTKEKDSRKAMLIAEELERVAQHRIPIHKVRESWAQLVAKVYQSEVPSATVREFITQWYDLRKLKGHGLLERDGSRYAYRLTTKGIQVALLFLFFHKRLCGPLANSRFHHRPDASNQPLANSKLPITRLTRPSRISSSSSLLLLDPTALPAGSS